MSESDNQAGRWFMWSHLALNSEGTQIFKDFTSAHVGQILGITLDKEVISAPSVNNAITGGKGVD